MSTHLLIAAAYLEDLPQGRKLVLMAIADSADEHTLESAPGLPKLRAWSGLTKGPTLANVKALEDAGLVARVEAGRLGRRAVYRVFPAGVPAIPHPSEVAARYTGGGSCPQDPHDLSTDGDNAPSYPQGDEVEGPARDTHRVLSDAPRVLPARPLQSSTSVSMGDATPSSTGRRVDKPTSSASTGSGFPGARRAREDGTPAPRTPNEGPPCPVHLGQRVPCPLCARNAVSAEDAADKIKAARRGLRTARTPTTTEERSA